MTKKQTTIITVLSVTAIILALLVSGRYWFRLDLTKNRAFTISKVSRNLHTELPDPVDITYFISGRLRTDARTSAAVTEIEDTLNEFAAHSKGRIRLTVRDPVKASLTAVADELGLQAVPMQITETDQASILTVYSGIVIEYLGKLSVIPWILSTNSLEYDLISRIRSLIAEREHWIGVIIGDSFRQWSEDFSYLENTLSSAGYSVRQIFPGDEIPDNCPALLVFGGAEELDHWALYRIDRYIQLGGKVLFAVEGISVDTVYGSLNARNLEDQGLLEMIASYGVTVRPELALDRNALTIQYQTTSQQGSRIHRITRYPLWIGVTADSGNDEHPVSANFSGLDLYWASPLALNPTAYVEVYPLFTSTPQGWAMRENLNTSPEVPYMLEMEASETTGVKILGAALNGLFNSYFKDAPKPEREGSEEELPDMPARPSPARIIVVGDTDFATNMILNTQARQNLDFLLRAADWLANDDDIISIRNRQPFTGRLDKILDSSKKAAAMRFSQILNVGLIPLFVIAAAFILSYRRRLRAKTAAQAADTKSAESSSREGGNEL